MTESDVSREIAKRVRDQITRSGMSQAAVARALGWQQQRLARRLTSADYGAPFTAAELTQVAEVLGVPTASFIPDADDQPAEVTA